MGSDPDTEQKKLKQKTEEKTKKLILLFQNLGWGKLRRCVNQIPQVQLVRKSSQSNSKGTSINDKSFELRQIIYCHLNLPYFTHHITYFEGTSTNDHFLASKSLLQIT